jgi:acetyltransferase-like isoleucine patch superfamily enzyme
MGHHYIGTEHLLLGLVREGEGVAVDVLRGMGVSLEKVRAQTRHLIAEGPVEKEFMEVDQVTYRLYPNVQLGKNAQIGDYVLIGHPPRGKKPGELPVVIGDNAVIRSHTVIYAGTVIGHNFQTGHRATIREGNQIGDDVSVGTGVTIDNDCKIGNDVRFRGHDLIGEYTVIEDGCWIGPHVAITNALHPRCPKAKECMKGPTLKRGAKIGANSTLLPDITIGEMALVGAGSVVADDVPPRAVVVGNPARVVKTIDELECPYGLIERPYEG